MPDEHRSLIRELENKIRVQQQQIELLNGEYNASLNAYKQLEKAFCLSPAHLYWKDKNGVYQACNDQQAITLGYKTGKDIVGKTDFDLPWKKKGGFLRQIDIHVMETKSECVVEEPLFLQNDRLIVFLSRKVPFYDENNDIAGIVGISIDISKEKFITQSKIASEVERKIHQKLSIVAANLSYEIRSIMAGLRLGIERSKHFISKLYPSNHSMSDITECQTVNDVTPEEFKDYQDLSARMLQRIDSGVALMDLQLKNMLTHRIERHLFQKHRIKNCIQQAIVTFPLDNMFLHRKIHLVIVHDFIIQADSLLTKYLLWNLLHNAVQAIKEEGRGEIFISTEETTRHFLLRFKNTARGILPAQAAQIFKSFHIDEHDPNLGLHFCQFVMKAYGGRIKCQAAEGRYTEFLLFFPK